MSVAQQIAYSLARLDHLLGVLAWRGATADINAITAQVFPPDPGATRDWWGGVWLGTSALPSANGAILDVELRLYFNLRHGDASTRWRLLAGLVLSFGPSSFQSALENWLATWSAHAIPVGLGVVVVAGRVCAMRAYVGVKNPTLQSLFALSPTVSVTGLRALTETFGSFTDRFGPMRPQAVTVGYDFNRASSGSFLPELGRVKVDICCHLIAPELRPLLVTWITQVLSLLSLNSCSLERFLAGVHTVWSGSEVQFLSIGFAPNLDHVTVYVKPCD